MQPKCWNTCVETWPPLTSKDNLLKEFGVIILCDHRRSSGCDIAMRIVRAYARYPENDMFKIQMATGWHRYACNHTMGYNIKSHLRLPTLHPMVDLYIRKTCKTNHLAGMPTVWRLVEEGLQAYLRVTPALHCNYPHAREDYDYEKDRQKKICRHKMIYSTVATLDGYSNAASMPGTILLPRPIGDIDDVNPVGSVQTEDIWTTIHHMLIEDGHSSCGSFVFHPHVVKQCKAAIVRWGQYYRGKMQLAPATTADSSVGGMHAHFTDNNLFALWEKMITRKAPQKGDAGVLDPFQWNTIGLLYAETRADKQPKSKKRDTPHPAPPDPELHFAESFMEPDPETLHTDLKYDCVIVYGSLISLMVGVKAWAMRDISGRVQFCADNMYNCLKGVPNMYWFNVGIMDAKGLHFPTVQALTLGRKKPRNKVQIEPSVIPLAKLSLMVRTLAFDPCTLLKHMH